MKKAQAANFPEFEQEMLKVWDAEKTFQQSLDNRKDAKRFRFYDGPPFANGLPHYGHALASTEKDAVTRYKTMRGYYVSRRAGWDTHGLPVEYEVEKQLGLKNKREIVEYGVEKFNKAARDSVFKYRKEWVEFFHRFGRWIDTDNDYATLDDSYIESVWWVFSELHKKGLVYRDFRSSPYCPRCATPLSNFELNQGYQDNVEDPSVYVKFRLAGDDGTSLLAWTTTPWTLPANAALAVKADADYATVELQDDGDSWKTGEKLILAKDRLSELELRKAEYKVVKTQKGSELAGLQYRPVYEFGVDGGSDEAMNAWKVYVDDSVDLGDGTGILHVAPRYGETDLALGQREHLPLIESVDANGRMVQGFKDVDGLASIVDVFFKDADSHIIADLGHKGSLFAAETFTHTYPFCWRCDTPLMYYATPSWFVQVTKLRDRLVETNQDINWVPAHVKDGRFGNWLAEARDWSVSRNRFWGAPIPIWMNVEDESDILVLSSLDELRQLSGHEGKFDLHRPGIDQVEVKKDGKTYRRIEEVFDCWFESGSMPYAEEHYPFEGKERWEEGFPADFIAEGMDQTRGWFYTLHVLGTALFDKPAFKNVIASGIINAADGKKLSKRLKNYPEPEEIFAKYGADSLRLTLMTSPVVAGETMRFGDDIVRDVYRNVFMTLWNVHSFFTTYAEVDGWQPPKELAEPNSDNVLDKWMLSRLNQAIAEVTQYADRYELNRATRPLRELIDDLSNWYVRRSRRRFWKSEDDGDKQSAYATLHYVLVRTAQLLAPWSPFVSDKLWRELTEGMSLPASVHVSDWPEAGEIDSEILDEMNILRNAVTSVLEQRARAGIKLRQPLSKVEIQPNPFRDDLLEILREEANVKKVVFESRGKLTGIVVQNIKLDTNITPELAREGMMREVVRHVQNLRKQSSLQVDDHIQLTLQSDDSELAKAIGEFRDTIMTETLADGLSDTHVGEVVAVKVGDSQLNLSVAKV
jgi:isoleucyl-tRNA synthetase